MGYDENGERHPLLSLTLLPATFRAIVEEQSAALHTCYKVCYEHFMYVCCLMFILVLSFVIRVENEWCICLIKTLLLALLSCETTLWAQTNWNRRWFPRITNPIQECRTKKKKSPLNAPECNKGLAWFLLWCAEAQRNSLLREHHQRANDSFEKCFLDRVDLGWSGSVNWVVVRLDGRDRVKFVFLLWGKCN